MLFRSMQLGHALGIALSIAMVTSFATNSDLGELRSSGLSAEQIDKAYGSLKLVLSSDVYAIAS